MQKKKGVSGVFVFLICSLGSVSCYRGAGAGLTANVGVFVSPFSVGDSLQSTRPRIAYNSGGAREAPCRKTEPNLRSIRNVKDLEAISELYGLKEEESSSSDSAVSSAENNRDEPVMVSVDGAWIELGLVIANNNKGVSKNYILAIDRLEFDFTNTDCPQDTSTECSYQATVSGGYCGLPFLYLVSPGSKVDYKKFSDNPLENLVLYVDGIPVTDRTANPEGESGSALIIPKYKVRLTLLGNFYLKDGTNVEPFIKTIGFSTSAQRKY